MFGPLVLERDHRGRRPRHRGGFATRSSHRPSPMIGNCRFRTGPIQAVVFSSVEDAIAKHDAAGHAVTASSRSLPIAAHEAHIERRRRGGSSGSASVFTSPPSREHAEEGEALGNEAAHARLPGTGEQRVRALGPQPTAPARRLLDVPRELLVREGGRLVDDHLRPVARTACGPPGDRAGRARPARAERPPHDPRPSGGVRYRPLMAGVDEPGAQAADGTACSGTKTRMRSPPLSLSHSRRFSRVFCYDPQAAGGM